MSDNVLAESRGPVALVTINRPDKLNALNIAIRRELAETLDRLRDGPYIQSGREISRAVDRLEEIRALANGLPSIDRFPPGRVTALARFASAAKAQAVSRMPDDRRAATLLAFIRTLEASAGDDVIDLLAASDIDGVGGGFGCQTGQTTVFARSRRRSA